MNCRIQERTLWSASGGSLVSFMVGSLIAVLVIVVSLNFYKNQVKMTGSMRTSANYNGQLSFFLTSTKIQLSRAGYGILRPLPATTFEDITIEETGDGTNSVYWRYEADDVRCLGMQERHESVPGIPTVVTLFFMEARDCALAPPLESLNWQPIERIARFQSSKIDTFLLNEDWVVSYSLTPVYCAPFGLNVDTRFKRARLKITAPSYQALAGDIDATGGSIIMDVCLNNIRM